MTVPLARMMKAAPTFCKEREGAFVLLNASACFEFLISKRLRIPEERSLVILDEEDFFY